MVRPAADVGPIKQVILGYIIALTPYAQACAADKKKADEAHKKLEQSVYAFCLAQLATFAAALAVLPPDCTQEAAEKLLKQGLEEVGSTEAPGCPALTPTGCYDDKPTEQVRAHNAAMLKRVARTLRCSMECKVNIGHKFPRSAFYHRSLQVCRASF